jgi:hypothetical protein
MSANNNNGNSSRQQLFGNQPNKNTTVTMRQNFPVTSGMSGISKENHIQVETLHHAQAATKNSYPATTQSRQTSGNNLYKPRSTAMMGTN